MPSQALREPQGAQRYAGPCVWGGQQASGVVVLRELKGHFTTSPSHIQITSSAAFWQRQHQDHRCWLGCAQPMLGGGQLAAESKNPSDCGSVWCKPAHGRGFTHSPHWTLTSSPNSWDQAPCSPPSRPVELFPYTEAEGWPALPAASLGARPLLFLLMLTSPCAALCVTHDYKSYSNREDYFYLLDSTTGKLIVMRGCKEWFTFPALGKIMT